MPEPDKHQIARGAEAISDLLVMLNIDPDERDDFGLTTAETLARAVLRAANDMHVCGNCAGIDPGSCMFNEENQ